MKALFLFFLCLTSALVSAQVPQLQQASDKAQGKIGTSSSTTPEVPVTMLANPLVGTGGHGHTFPGVCAPFGMVQLSPDTRYEGWDGCGGYHYSDSIIYGFSHTHLSGTGVPDYADLLICPQSGEAKWNGKFQDPSGYGSRFSHNSEVARVGYYQVTLEDEQIVAQLAASERAGIHEYTFLNASEKKYILLDLNYRDKLLKGGITVLNDSTVSGFRISEAWANEQHFYFHLKTSIPFIQHTLHDQNGELKLLLEFPTDTKVVCVSVGMSMVDANGAAFNLLSEIPHFSVQKVFMESAAKWSRELSKIKFVGLDQNASAIFYTALYHCMVAPNLMSDVDGRYRGRDQKIHQLASLKDQQYTVFSLWDTYRANHPLFTLIDQKRSNAFIRTFLRQYEEGGDLPVWELAACETECMIGYHSVSVIADAFLKGIRDYDANNALKAMVSTAHAHEFGKEAYAKQGYISSSDEPESVSRTLEYAYDDDCIARMAKALGQEKIATEFEQRSYNFINVFDPESKFMRARRGAQWYGPFDPSEVNFNYTEANSWQYSLAAPQHIETLIQLLGGRDSLEAWLDRLFTTNMQLSGREQADITGLIGQYAHGNEPSHHMAYLYNYTNAPYKTQYYVDRILKDMYQNAPDGLSGNEDCGQMSAWYVMSALGFYAVSPGIPVYQIGRPFANYAKIRLENGKSIEVICKNQALNHPYIQEAYWNGQLLTTLALSHDQLMQGGTLQLSMGATPAKRTNLSNPTDKPSNFLPVPYIATEQRVFNDSLLITCGFAPMAPDQAHLNYRINGAAWQSYKEAFYITEQSKIELQLSTPKKAGPIVSATFIKKDPNVKLSLGSSYSNQYTASGPDALIDGIEGGNEFRTGDYQGYYNQHVIATLELKEARVISEVGISYIRDQKAWIFAPAKLQVEASTDGQTYHVIAEKTLAPASKTDKNPFREELLLLVNSDKRMAYKYLRYTIENPGKLPAWHLGAGNPTWLFIDELIYR
ncbi:MAG: hypothetical protein RLZZ301_1141 [Bacteroidota bacterium]|jgi:predicted alpha-1,2-mannosidase